jgi:hypothetical protein
MYGDEWTGTRPDGKTVKYTYKYLTENFALATATVEGESVTATMNNISKGLSRQEVENLFCDPTS